MAFTSDEIAEEFFSSCVQVAAFRTKSEWSGFHCVVTGAQASEQKRQWRKDNPLLERLGKRRRYLNNRENILAKQADYHQRVAKERRRLRRIEERRLLALTKRPGRLSYSMTEFDVMAMHALHGLGMSFAEVGKTLNVSDTCVGKWIRRGLNGEGVGVAHKGR